MKVWKRGFALLFALLALIVAVAGVYVALSNRNAAPVLVRPADGALQAAAELFEAVESGDYTGAQQLLFGTPNLGVDRKAEGMVNRLLWNAWQESLTFTAQGDAFATDDGVGQRYTVRYLDVNSVTDTLRVRSQKLLEERVAQAKDVSELYDSQNEYRADVVMDVLYDAAKAALAEDAAYVELTFTANMVYRDGRWWVLADDALLAAITGSLAG